MEKTGIAELVFVLDMSGSMEDFRQETIDGFNANIAEQKGRGDKILVSVSFLDVLLYGWCFRVPIDEVPEVTLEDYTPDNRTALCDAVGTTILSVMTDQLNDPPESRPDKTLFSITTDGKENASCIYTSDAIRHMIRYVEESCGWEFVLYGANIDILFSAGKYGIRRGNAFSYRHNAAGYQELYAMKSRKLKEFLN